MISQLSEYYAFYDVVLACSLLSNDGSDAYRRDAAELVSFYGQAHGFDADTIKAWTECVCSDLAAVSLLDEREAMYSRRAISRRYKELDLLYDVKSDVISEISGKYARAQTNTMFVNPMWFDYTHVVLYHPAVRYRQLLAASSSGWCVAAREVGMMLALGIGVARDYEAAKRKFLQCIYWCDAPSCLMLAYLCRLTGDEAGAKLYGDLAQLLMRYLKDGVTVVPEAVRADYDAKAVVKYAQISSIYRDVCCKYNREDIDYSFVEVMMDDCIDDNRKMNYINNYNRNTWVEATNPSVGAPAHIGFAGGHNGE